MDVQQIIPLPEAAHYQIQVREKVQKERAVRISRADYTRFDLDIAEESYKSVSKRNAIYIVCKHLVTAGVDPMEIASVFTWRSNAIYWVDSSVGADEFFNLASAKASAGGPSFDAPRWFCEDDELFHANNRTYAFTKMWGGASWKKAMDFLKEKYVAFSIEYSPTN